jgi:hypothetical protein
MASLRDSINNSTLVDVNDAIVERMCALVERIKEDLMKEDDEIAYILANPQIPEDPRGDYAYAAAPILSTPNRNGDRFPVQPAVPAVEEPQAKPTAFNGHVFMRTETYACQDCAFAEKCVNAPPPTCDVFVHLCETWLTRLGVSDTQEGCWIPEDRTWVCHDPDSMFYGYRYIYTNDSMCESCAFHKQCSEGNVGDDRVTVLCEAAAGVESGYWERSWKTAFDADTLFQGYKWETEGGCAKCNLRAVCSFKEMCDECKTRCGAADDTDWFDGRWVVDSENPPKDRLVKPSVKFIEVDLGDVARRVAAEMGVDPATGDAILDEKAAATRKLNALVDTDPTGQMFWVGTMEQSCKDCHLRVECAMVRVGNNVGPSGQQDTWRKFIKLCKLRIAYQNYGHWLKKIPEQSASDADKALFEGFEWVPWVGNQTVCSARCEVKRCDGCEDSATGKACKRVIASTKRNLKGHWRWILDLDALAGSRFKGYHVAYLGSGCAKCEFKACDNPDQEDAIITDCINMRGGVDGQRGTSRARGNWERDTTYNKPTIASDNAANTAHSGNEIPTGYAAPVDQSVVNTRFKGYEYVDDEISCDVCEFTPCKTRFDSAIIADCISYRSGSGCWKRIPGSQVRITAKDTPFDGYAYRADKNQTCSDCPVCRECSEGDVFTHKDCLAISHELPGRWVDAPCDKDGFEVSQD